MVWFAADERITTPSVFFLVHEVNSPKDEEDPELRVATKNFVIDASTEAVRVAAGDQAAQYWRERMNDKEDGSILHSQEAIDIGWATELRKYK